MTTDVLILIAFAGPLMLAPILFARDRASRALLRALRSG